MRGKKAKTIRRAVYGDQSLRVKRKYIAEEFHRWFGLKPVIHRTLRNAPDSLRAIYQKAKKDSVKGQAV